MHVANGGGGTHIIIHVRTTPQIFVSFLWKILLGVVYLILYLFLRKHERRKKLYGDEGRSHGNSFMLQCFITNFSYQQKAIIVQNISVYLVALWEHYRAKCFPLNFLILGKLKTAAIWPHQCFKTHYMPCVLNGIQLQAVYKYYLLL